MEITSFASSSLPQTFQPRHDDTLKSSTIDKVVRLVIATGLLTTVGIGIVCISPFFPITSTIAAIFLGFSAIGLIKQVTEQLLGNHSKPPKIPTGTLDSERPSRYSQPTRKFKEPKDKDLDSYNRKLGSETPKSPTVSDSIDRSPRSNTGISRNQQYAPLKALSWYSPFESLFRYDPLPSMVPTGIPGKLQSEDKSSTDYSPMRITDKNWSEDTSGKSLTADSTYTPLQITDKKWDDLNVTPRSGNQPLRIKDLDEQPRIEIID